MRKFVFAAVMLLGIVAIADDITTLDGRTYRNVKITLSDPISITVSHSNGVGRILFQEMSEELQKKYGYDAAKAAAYLDQLKAKRAVDAGKQSTDYATPFDERTTPSQEQPTKITTQSSSRNSSDTPARIGAETPPHPVRKYTLVPEEAITITVQAGRRFMRGKRNSSFFAILLSAVITNCWAWDYIKIDLPSGAKESLWRDALARLWNGKTEIVVEGGRIDVLTDTSAVEVDWPHKWHEGLGQALHYADVTGKQAVLALISYSQGPDNLQKESVKRFNMVDEECKKHGIRLVILFPTKPEAFKHTERKREAQPANAECPKPAVGVEMKARALGAGGFRSAQPGSFGNRR